MKSIAVALFIFSLFPITGWAKDSKRKPASESCNLAALKISKLPLKKNGISRDQCLRNGYAICRAAVGAISEQICYRGNVTVGGIEGSLSEGDFPSGVE